MLLISFTISQTHNKHILNFELELVSTLLLIFLVYRSVLGGIISDKTGRRKPLVIISCEYWWNFKTNYITYVWSKDTIIWLSFCKASCCKLSIPPLPHFSNDDVHSVCYSWIYERRRCLLRRIYIYIHFW